MEPFTTLTAVAAPMPMQNIDTDKIIPARFLKTIKRSGLGVHLFDPLRFDKDGHTVTGTYFYNKYCKDIRTVPWVIGINN